MQEKTKLLIELRNKRKEGKGPLLIFFVIIMLTICRSPDIHSENNKFVIDGEECVTQMH
jgi:hypothetical protein